MTRPVSSLGDKSSRPRQSDDDTSRAAYELLAAIRRIAAMPLWGEAIDAGSLRDDYAAAGEYDLALDEFNPSADTESALLRDAVELARLVLLSADGQS